MSINVSNDLLNDVWLQDDFEDQVAATLIGLYESGVKSQKGVAAKIKEKDFNYLKSKTVYIPSNSRVIMASASEVNKNEIIPGCFDTINDSIPKHGFQSIYDPLGRMGASCSYDGNGYDKKSPINFLGFRRAKSLPSGWSIVERGKLFEFLIFSPEEKRIRGEKRFFTINEVGEINCCDYIIDGNLGFGNITRQISISEPWVMNETNYWVSMLMQMEADKRFCWRIKASESGASVDIGCTKEEIKSLLYARDLPMTSTGRKRPLLHLVESHKRRVKNGTDIEVIPFLRGTQKIVMNSTEFTVRPPLVRMPELSEHSQRYY